MPIFVKTLGNNRGSHGPQVPRKPPCSWADIDVESDCELNSISGIAEPFKYPESVTPTTCASVNGDDDDDHSILEDISFEAELACVQDVKLIVKRTFIEFRPLDEDGAPKMRRNKSEPVLARAGLDSDRTGISEAATPTTCMSVNGGDDQESLSSFSPDTSASETADGGQDQQGSKKKSSRRSGRARQRENARRRIRTPSPCWPRWGLDC